MGAPILFSCHFGGGQFTRLAKVLERTAARHCPAWSRRIVELPRHTVRAQEASYADNTYKLDLWNALVQELPDDARVLLIDADTAILRSLDAVWNFDFDVAYTVRPAPYKLPLNAGVVFLRVNERSKVFMQRWAEINRRMVTDRELHRKWMRKFGGMNQAALGCVMSDPTRSWTIAKLPCVEWNCEDSGWPDYSPDVTRILHVKSALRRAVFNLQGPRPAIRSVVKLWRALDREATELPA